LKISLKNLANAKTSSHKNSVARGCGDGPQLLFPLENNIHHFDLILLPGLTLHTETNDVTANLKKKENIRVKASGPLVVSYFWALKENTNINKHTAKMMCCQVFICPYSAKGKGLVDYQGRETAGLRTCETTVLER